MSIFFLVYSSLVEYILQYFLERVIMRERFLEIVYYENVIILCSCLGVEVKVEKHFYSNVEANAHFLVSCAGIENSEPSDS